MTDQSNGNQNHKNGFGPVARDKYEKIIRDRISRSIGALEKQIDAHRDEALQRLLMQIGISDKLAQCRTIFDELNASLEADNYIRPTWLCNDLGLLGIGKIRQGVDTLLRNKASLKPLFTEIDRLRGIEDKVAEKVWLAGAPGEIAELLKEIGEGSATPDQ